MVFSSPIFLFLFLPIVLVLYLLLGEKLRNMVLFVASLFLYSWGEGQYVLVMLFSILANYLFARFIDTNRGKKAKWFLVGAVCSNLGVLFFFKYANFVVANLNHLLGGIGVGQISLAPVHLPIGISFFTFQAMSYVIDVYRKESPVQKNPFNVGLYIALFPQLIAGPIIRYHDVARQINERNVSVDSFAYGVKRFVCGLGKKLLIADTVGLVADKIFNIPELEMTVSLSWLGILCYSLQIYFDFSGYSDMAIGLGRMFGFEFLENFNYPYISRSIKEFWRRWHISLSTWFRDYLYIPLGGNKKGSVRTYLNLLIVFFLCGFWHGASWNFLLWGLFHGGFLVLERLWLGAVLKRLWRPVVHFYTLVIVSIGWVLFRAESFYQIRFYLKAMCGFAKGDGTVYFPALYLNNNVILAIIIGLVGATPVIVFLQETQKKIMTCLSDELKKLVRLIYSTTSIVMLVSLLVFLAMSLAGRTYNPFIYFRF